MPTHDYYTFLTWDEEIRHFFNLIGYEGSLAKIGQIKRPGPRKEWNFYFDCITRAFSSKCTNFDALSIMTQQIGYSLIYDTHYDFCKVLLNFIGDRLSADRETVYYVRFCLLLFNYRFPNVKIS